MSEPEDLEASLVVTEQEAAWRNDALAQAWYARAERLGIWPRDQKARLGLLGQAMDFAREYAENDLGSGRCLVLLGSSGNGKTWAGIALLRAHYRQDIRYWYVPRLVSRMLTENGDEVIDTACRAWLLMLDDLGVEYIKPGGAMETKFDWLLSERYGRELPTIITCNLSREAFAQRVTPRIVDRLRDWGSIYVVTAPTFRGG